MKFPKLIALVLTAMLATASLPSSFACDAPTPPLSAVRHIYMTSMPSSERVTPHEEMDLDRKAGATVFEVKDLGETTAVYSYYPCLDDPHNYVLKITILHKRQCR